MRDDYHYFISILLGCIILHLYVRMTLLCVFDGKNMTKHSCKVQKVSEYTDSFLHKLHRALRGTGGRAAGFRLRCEKLDYS